ncbi:MAG TPA: MBL fold metallo-hydrolase, partial [Clostridiales bacterium]|nr:MBL fold metallo-hydrolase [Clostridiales bacterium]
ATDQLGLKITAIFITHAHYDHICHIDDLREKTSADVYATQEESDALVDKYANASILFGSGKEYSKADCQLKDGELFKLGDEQLDILHTPGHTDGG